MDFIYTDGACRPNPGKGGWAYILVRDDKLIAIRYGCEPNSTNNRMELMAIIKAFDIIDPENTTVIYTDSKLCEGLVNGRFYGKKNMDIVRQMRNLFKEYSNTVIRWKRGHDCDNPWNEIADKYAEKAINNI